VSPDQIVLLVGGILLGLAVGSFTCVVIDRLPLALDAPNEYGELWDTRPWREVLGGRSRCSDCGEPVRAWQNVPVVSWLALRGRCRSCGARIPAFHPIVEAAVPVVSLLVVWGMGMDWDVLPVVWLVPVGLAVAVIDLRTLMVPTRIVWPALAVSVLLSVAAVPLAADSWSRLLTAAVGLATFAGPLFAIWFLHPRGMGFGDVRLACLLGWTVGWAAGDRPLGAVVLVVITLAVASILGIVIGVVALGARGRKAQVPFGPSLIAGTLLCAVLAGPILDPFGITI
jgi:leader peptidase (prepilin peptidase)/N-methyltransferase